MRIQLGLENFLTEEQKQLLSAFDVEMRRIRNTPEHDQQFDTVIQICGDFTMSVYRHVLTRDVQHESAECLHENMPEANDETNTIHSSCKNREE